MNANRNMIAVSTMTAALATVVVSFVAMADDYRGPRRGERTVMIDWHVPRKTEIGTLIFRVAERIGKQIHTHK